ncbi:MAG: DUF4293 family protein [Bacteroidetes bacterium]|nr:DUF4293 family protein [Bacteroidota bacterium]
MIQRIQTVYLVLAALMALLCMFLPLGFLPDEPTRDAVLARENLALLAIGLVMVSLPLGAVFLYAKRPVQLRMVFAGLLAVMAFAGLVLVELARYLSEVIWTVGSFLPIVYALVLALAIRGIRHDEHLVRSMDRLR